MNIDQSDPEASDLVRRLFPTAEVGHYTVWQRLGDHWAHLLHRFGIHNNIWTYQVDLTDWPMSVPPSKRLECSICHRPAE